MAYTGKPHDDVTGLTYMGARYYDPEVGRFMGMDPVGYQEDNPVSYNRYAYANNNPYKFVDPDGRAAIEAAFVPTGKYTNQKMAWRLNVKLTTNKFDYYAQKFGAASWKGIAGKVIIDKVVGPRGEGDNASGVVAIDKILEKNRLGSKSAFYRDIDPDNFINTINGLPKKDRDLFKSVHGQSASQMVEEAKGKYNKSIMKKKVIDGMSKNVE